MSTGPIHIKQSYRSSMLKLDVRNERNTSSLNSSSVYVSNQKQRKGGSCLLLIDPQYDFIDGTLKVDGAKEDCPRIAKFIRDNLDNLQEIYVTLDSHMNYHIAHPCFWQNSQKKHPNIFQTITHRDVKNRVWVPVDATMYNWAKAYTKELEEKPRLKGLEAFQLTIWPPHCLIGTPGHAVDAEIAAALREWELKNLSPVHYIMKGNNSKTEHYSAFRAEVIVPEDPGTHFNEKLFRDLNDHRTIYVAGEAQSHCVNFTVRDLVAKLGPKDASEKLVLLEGGMSNVGGFAEQGEKFINDMKTLPKCKGIKVKSIVNNGLRAIGYGIAIPNQKGAAEAVKAL